MAELAKWAKSCEAEARRRGADNDCTWLL